MTPAVVPNILSSSSISTKDLDDFCNKKGEFFIGLLKLMQKLDVNMEIMPSSQSFASIILLLS